MKVQVIRGHDWTSVMKLTHLVEYGLAYPFHLHSTRGHLTNVARELLLQVNLTYECGRSLDPRALQLQVITVTEEFGVSSA